MFNELINLKILNIIYYKIKWKQIWKQILKQIWKQIN